MAEAPQELVEILSDKELSEMGFTSWTRKKGKGHCPECNGKKFETLDGEVGVTLDEEQKIKCLDCGTVLVEEDLKFREEDVMEG